MKYLPETYNEHAEAVFVDSGSLTNLLAGVSLSSIDLVSSCTKNPSFTLNVP